MKLSVLALLAVAVVGCAGLSAHADTVSQVAGTYEIIICKRACSFSDRENVIATAALVLFDHVMTLEEWSRIDPNYNYDTRDSNACYTVSRKDGAQTYAGVSKKGISPWVLNGDTIEFNLFRSPDAGYSVEVNQTGNLLAGTGKSWGAGMGAPPKEYGPDIIVARRLGPPNISACRAKA
jgi:hypothetical protein